MNEEVTALEFGTQMGPVWPATMYLAVCAWPDSLPQRTRLVRALLHAGSRAAGWRHPGPDRRVLERRINRASDRLELAFKAAEVAQLAHVPPEIQFGPMKVLFPSRRAVGPSGKVSIKGLQELVAHDWQAPDGLRDSGEVVNDFRVRVWRRFLPAMHYIIPLKLYIQANPTDIVTLCRDTDWLNSALTSSENWATELLPRQQRINADIIRLVRA